MAAAGYLFLLMISFASGSYINFGQDGSHSEVIPNFYYPRRYIPYRKLAISPQAFLDSCMSKHLSQFECVKKLESVFRRFSENTNPKLENRGFIPNTGNLIRGNLNKNNKQVDQPENYINSILDEGKRDASSINASDNSLNSTWIEIKDPRKTATPTKSEIFDAKETSEFVSFGKEKIVTEEKDDASIAEEIENKRNNTARNGSNTDGEITTDVQQTTLIIENGSHVTGGKMLEKTTVPEETSDVTHIPEVPEGETTANKDSNNTGEIDEENGGSINGQRNTTSDSLSDNTEKSTTDDLHTDSAEFRFKVTTENTTVSETTIEVTTEKETADRSSSTEQNLSTESTLTLVVSEGLNNDTTLATDETTTSTVLITTIPTKSESVSVSDADISSSSETESVTSSSTVIFPSVSVTDSTGYTTESTDGGFASTTMTDSKSSNGDHVTKSIPVVPEHTINIRSIKTAKIVLSVLLLVTGLIAVVMLAVYVFKVKRRAVQYDQLTLLP